VPKTVNPKTSLVGGHGIVVDALAVINEIKKQLNINVSLKRKIHIIALPQGTPLNAFWSDPQSYIKPFGPFGSFSISN
jgi:hypothetical protein